MTPHFHLHFTLALEKRMPPTPKGFKATVIELAAGHREQVDLMLTRHHPGDLAHAPLVIAHAKKLAQQLQRQTGCPVLRTKVEFVGEFDQPLTPRQYLEAHIKTCSTEAAYPETLARLRQLADGHDFRLSTNPLERKDGLVRHFANLRVKDGSTPEGLARVHTVQALLQEAGIRIEQTHIELNVWDSNAPHDAWWTAPLAPLPQAA